MSEFGVGEFGDDTEVLYNQARVTLANLQLAPGQNAAVTQIVALVTQEQASQDVELGSGDVVRFKGLLETLNSMLTPLEVQAGNQGGTLATTMLAGQLIAELRDVRRSLLTGSNAATGLDGDPSTRRPSIV